MVCHPFEAQAAPSISNLILFKLWAMFVSLIYIIVLYKGQSPKFFGKTSLLKKLSPFIKGGLNQALRLSPLLKGGSVAGTKFRCEAWGING